MSKKVVVLLMLGNIITGIHIMLALKINPSFKTAIGVVLAGILGLVVTFILEYYSKRKNSYRW